MLREQLWKTEMLQKNLQKYYKNVLDAILREVFS